MFCKICFQAGNYMFKVNNRNPRARCEICSKLTLTTQERRPWRSSGVSFEHSLPGWLTTTQYKVTYFRKMYRSSHRKCFVKKVALKNFAYFTGRQLCWSLLIIKLQTLRPSTQVLFSCEICEIFKETYFEEHLRTTASKRFLLISPFYLILGEYNGNSGLKWLRKTRIQYLRSSHQEVFLGKGVLNICSKFIGEHPCRSMISIKLLSLLKSHFGMGVLL